MIKGKYAVYTCLFLTTVQNALFTIANSEFLNTTIEYPSLLFTIVSVVFLDGIIYKHRNLFQAVFITLLTIIYHCNVEIVVTKFVLQAIQPALFFLLKDKVFYETTVDSMHKRDDYIEHSPSIVTGINLAFVIYWKLTLYTYPIYIKIIACILATILSFLKYIIETSDSSEYTITKIKRKLLVSNIIQMSSVGYLWTSYSKYVDFSHVYRIEEIIHEINRSLFYCSVCVLAASHFIHKSKNLHILIFSSPVCVLIMTILKIWVYPVNELATIFYTIVILVQDLQKNLLYVNFNSFCTRLSLGYDLIAFMSGNVFCYFYQNKYVDILVNVVWLLTCIVSIKYHNKMIMLERCEVESTV
jgi:hypothetical protein